MCEKNLLVKLTGILLVANMVVNMTGCTDNNSKYVVTKENNTMVLHKAKSTLLTKRLIIDCGVEIVKMEASYNNSPNEYAYDVKCDECFNEN